MKKHQFKIALLFLFILIGFGLYTPTLIQNKVASTYPFQAQPLPNASNLDITDKIDAYRKFYDEGNNAYNQQYWYNQPDKTLIAYFQEIIQNFVPVLTGDHYDSNEKVSIYAVSVYNIPTSTQSLTVWDISFSYKDIQGMIAIDDTTSLPLYVSISSPESELIESDALIKNITDFLKLDYETIHKDYESITIRAKNTDISIRAFQYYFEFNGTQRTVVLE